MIPAFLHSMHNHGNGMERKGSCLAMHSEFVICFRVGIHTSREYWPMPSFRTRGARDSGNSIWKHAIEHEFLEQMHLLIELDVL